eukprot:1157186-Pelagomonas_calceolata.AAC.16
MALGMTTSTFCWWSSVRRQMMAHLGTCGLGWPSNASFTLLGTGLSSASHTDLNLAPVIDAHSWPPGSACSTELKLAMACCKQSCLKHERSSGLGAQCIQELSSAAWLVFKRKEKKAGFQNVIELSFEKGSYACKAGTSLKEAKEASQGPLPGRLHRVETPAVNRMKSALFSFEHNVRLIISPTIE